MKKLHILFLVSFFSLISKISAQQDKTIFGEETFTYEKIDIIDIDKGTTIPLTKNKTKQTSNSKSSPSVKSSGSGIGETPGHLSVSFTGAAIYEIPIAVPQGIDGIVPEISLAYNSQGGNGIAGYGWNIKGISTISRIPSSTYYDNRIDGVNFDNSDRFSLDGERLILKSGAYGANGAVYETEKYSNVKITSYGTSPYGSGPSYFIVNYPDGSVARYGSSSDSITHTNYAITYWENPQGIRISYEYTYQYNSQYIDKIKYSSLNSITPINEISFNYHNGERITHGYVHDVSQVRSRILNRIESYSGGILYRKYNLSYDQTQLKYNRLTHLTEYSGDETESHSSIEFTYDDSQSSISHSGLTTSLALNNIEQRNAQVVSLDMTGNGKMDFIVYPNEKDKFWMFTNIQNGSYNSPYLANTGAFETLFPTTLLSWQNKILSGQGLTVVQKGSNNQIEFKVLGKAPPSAGGYPLVENYIKVWNAPTYLQNNIPTNYQMEYVSGDFNGDGLTDVLAIGKPNNNSSNFRGVYFINLRRDITTNFANTAGMLNVKLSGDYKLYTGDFNGDGKTDLLHITNGKLHVYSIDNYTNQLSLIWSTTDTAIKATDPIMLGDYNGDGKTDFMTPTTNNSKDFNTFLSTGTRFDKGTHRMPFTYRKTNWDGGNGVFYGYNLIPLDVNGDGKTDIVEYNTVTYNDRPSWLPPPPEGTQTIKVYNNLRIISNSISIPHRIKFENGGEDTKTGNLKHYPIPIFLTSNQQNKSLDFSSISHQWVTNFSFNHDHREDVLLKGIENNGVSYEIDYGNLDKNTYNIESNGYVYEHGLDQIYPNIDIVTAPTTRVVSALRRYANLSSGTVMSKKVYAYKGAVINAEGLGFLGFEAIARSNWHTGDSDRIFSVSKFDPSLLGAMTEEYSMANYFSFTTPSSNYISKTLYNYSSSLSNRKVFKLWLDSSTSQNYLEGTFTNKSYQYDNYNNPTNISTNFMGGSKNQVITYSNNTGSNYHIGRPINTVSSTTLDGDTFSTEEEFSYTGYL